MADAFEIYRQACAEAGVGVYEQNAQSEFTYVSTHFQDLLRDVLKRDDIELLGKDPRDTFLFSADGPGRVELLRRHSAAKGAAVAFEFRLTDAHGQPIWFEARERVLLDDAGSFVGCRGVFIDVTARKAAEASSEAQSNFLTAVSHELRTPLNAIMGFSDLLVEEELVSMEGCAYLERMRAASVNLLSAIDAVVDFSTLNSSSLSPHNDRFPVLALVGDLLESRRSAVGDRHLQLTYTVEPSDFTITTDRALLGKCLGHLLDNAIRFTDQGAIALVARQLNPGWVEISVHDTGIGIEPAKLPQIFLPFVQADEGFSRAADGLGLGLTLARAITEKLGGRIDVASAPARGSTFTVHIPSTAQVS